MALVKFGAGIIQMAGSIAGTTFGRNRSGNYARSKTKPTNPKTALQTMVRSSLATLTIVWLSTVSAAQRAAWGTYAASVGMKNRLGETIQLSGFNHFIRSNVIRLQHGLAQIVTAPVIMELPGADETLAVAATADDQKIAVTFDNTQPWATEAGGHLLVYQGISQNESRNFFNGPWRLLGKVDGATPTAPTSPASLDAVYPVAAGQKVNIYARIMRADGRLSEPFRADSFASAS